MVTCRYCNEEIGQFSDSFKVLKNKLKSYDMYWFCNNDTCLKEYLENGEKSLQELKQKLEELK